MFKKSLIIISVIGLLLAIIVAVAMPKLTKFGATAFINADWLHKSVMQDIRTSMTDQKRFQTLLAKHEANTLAMNKTDYSKRYLYKTSLGSFGVPFKDVYDVFAVHIHTVVVDGKPKTHFIIRLGIAIDENAVAFFGNQTTPFYAAGLKLMYEGLDFGLRTGIINTVIFHVTDSDKTSHSESGYKPLSRWHKENRTLF